MKEVLGVIFILLAVYSLAAASGLFSERSGTVNLSIAGGMTMGALGYVLTTFLLTSQGKNQMEIWMVIIGLFVSIIFGLLTISLLAFASINLRGNQVVIGMAINIMVPIISLVVVVMLTTGNFTVPMTKLQITTGIESSLEPWMIQMIISFVVAFIMAGLFVLMRKTTFGLRLRSAGENPHALAATGVSVITIKHLAMLISGILAGFAGGLVVSAYAKFSSYANSTLGMGYIAIAILILGQWRMQFIVLGSLAFATMFAVIDHYSVQLAEYKHILAIIPYAMTIVSLPFISKLNNMPKADGIPYVNSGR